MEHLSQDLQNLEQQLRSFTPQMPQTSCEQLLYQAGWEAALAQHSALTDTELAGMTKNSSPKSSQRSSTPRKSNYYWAAACAALLLLSTTLGWQVWQQPQPGVTPSVVTTTPAAPTPKEIPGVNQTPHEAPMLAIPEPTLPREEPLYAESQPSALASYLELRQRVTRGGLSMWSVSTPVRTEPNAGPPTPARDWQAELLRETL